MADMLEVERDAALAIPPASGPVSGPASGEAGKQGCYRVVLLNPISGRGHLDAYARLYSQALLEIGCEVVLVAADDGGTGAFIRRGGPDLARRYRYISYDAAESAVRAAQLVPVAAEPASTQAARPPLGQPQEEIFPGGLCRAELPLWQRARLVLAQEGWVGIVRRPVAIVVRTGCRLLRVPAVRRLIVGGVGALRQLFRAWMVEPLRQVVRSVRRGCPSWILVLLRAMVRPLRRWRGQPTDAVDPGRISFSLVAEIAKGAVILAGEPAPDLVFVLYLDMMSEHPLKVAALEQADALPWAGILFHPRLAAAAEGQVERYFSTRTCRGAVFLVPGSVPHYDQALPERHFAQVPDVADLTLPDHEPALAATLRQRAAGRKIVLQIGSIAPHKGILTLLEVIERADPGRFFFALVGEVHWDSFGDDRERLQRFYRAPPANVLIHEGYVLDERDYNSVLATCDVIYAVYQNFNSSSNSLTKAAGLRRPILVTDGTLMARRVLESGLGRVARERDPADILAALTQLVEQPVEMTAPEVFLQNHSLASLKEVLRAALPHWCRRANSDIESRPLPV